MSDSRPEALGLWEFSSIPAGIEGADVIVKAAPIDGLFTGTTHPGKYVVIATGNAASVEVARDAIDEYPGRFLIDTLYLADIAPVVAAQLMNATIPVATEGEAIGVVETTTVASAIDAADAAVKYADVRLGSLRLADGLGGKAYFIIYGDIGEVQAGVEAAIGRAEDLITDSVVIAQLTPELRADLDAGAALAECLRNTKGTE